MFMRDAGYVLRADEISDDLWAVIEPVLPALAGRRGPFVERPPVDPGRKSPGSEPDHRGAICPHASAATNSVQAQPCPLTFGPQASAPTSRGLSGRWCYQEQAVVCSVR